MSSIPIRFSKVEASPERCWLSNYYWLHANTDGVVLCVGGIGSMTDFLHMFAMLSDEVWVVAFLPSLTVE